MTQRLSPSTIFLIASGCLLLMISFGIRSSYGLYMRPIEASTDWGRDIIGFALALQNLSWGIMSVFTGGLADRFGNRNVLFGGALVYALGVYLTAGVSDLFTLNAGLGFLVGAGVAGTSFGIVLPALVQSVPPERRDWVLGLGTACGSAGQFALVPLVQMFISDFGWINSLHILTAIALLMMLLAIPLNAKKSSVITETDQGFAETVRLAAGHKSYWLLVFGFFVCGFHVAFITAHMPAYLSDLGLAHQVGAWSLSLIGLFNIAGAFWAGNICRKHSRSKLLVAIYGGRTIAIALFLIFPITLTSVLIFSAVMGLLWLATVPPTSGIVMNMFGTRYMATLYGFVFFSHQVGSFSGVWLGGYLYETYGHYEYIWWAGIFFGLLAVLLHWPIDEKPHPSFVTKES
ncbi:MFS transporter [Marinobacterium sp. xm-a-152]|uniref:MFS transporter n=1 Tax=Marinobacterium sp. xm-a-152 TaxID=2497733 RepID=UPI0015682F3D|nr:MFS transporter [Marinobacterium sp. xm-a-152]NRP14590.1 putative MFS-type transporter YhjX [Marinobacterium sp. xm-a-152]